MYPDVHSLGGELVTVGEVWDSTKDSQMPRRLTFFSESLLHEVGAQSLVVGLKVASKPSQTSTEQITTRMLPGDPSRLGFPTNPRVTS